jgi:hypothetical protein
MVTLNTPSRAGNGHVLGHDAVIDRVDRVDRGLHGGSIRAVGDAGAGRRGSPLGQSL